MALTDASRLHEAVPDATPFGILLRTYREDRRLSQPVLAGKVGIAESSVSQWETGQRKGPRSRDTILLLADALGLNDEERLELLKAAGRDTPEDRKPRKEQVSVPKAVRLDPYLTSEEKDRLVELYETLVGRRRR